MPVLSALHMRLYFLVVKNVGRAVWRQTDSRNFLQTISSQKKRGSLILEDKGLLWTWSIAKIPGDENLLPGQKRTDSRNFQRLENLLETKQVHEYIMKT